MDNSSISEAFQRYKPYTDVKALVEYSAKPLRKCIRVNTLKTDIATVLQWGKTKGWQIDPVPWCPEGFFIDRENREEALGKDPLHLFGHFYMQEASSMLPVELLEPQPGDAVLDMAAAPGSKTTQIAAKLQGRGVVIANDMQEKRLWTLKSAVYRAGATNVIITKKMGQWFGKHMTERFDRVLCDAPCTAQGTIRKDATALDYSSELSVQKAAKLQKELLEAAIHACKVGGRVVYSTCTLTPEENEEVVQYILQKFQDQIEILDPRKLSINRAKSIFKVPVKDALRMQEKSAGIPMLRIWPQTFDSEGFFCAVIQKNATTMEPERMDRRPWREKEVKKGEALELGLYLNKRYGAELLKESDALYEMNNELFVLSDRARNFFLPTTPFSIGIPFGKKAKKPPLIVSHEFAILVGNQAQQNIIDVSDEEYEKLINGEDISCESGLEDHVLLRYKHFCIGLGRARDGKLKNHLPRGLINN